MGHVDPPQQSRTTTDHPGRSGRPPGRREGESHRAQVAQQRRAGGPVNGDPPRARAPRLSP